MSWLPLYHDMGLIGFVLAPLCAQRSVDLLAPSDFARRPLQWLSLIARRRATITYSPSFGYDLVTRRAQGQVPSDLDLSCLKIAGIGADMIQAPVLNRFAETFAPSGFDARAFLPSYGMAEVCVGLSFGRRFGGFRLDRPSGPRDFVMCGRALPGHVIEIRDEEGMVLSGRAVGQLFVRGPSVMPGYFLQPAASALVLKDGWLDTGDLGYWCDGELVVTGPRQGPDHRQWPQHLAAGHRMGHRGAAAGCAAATPAPSRPTSRPARKSSSSCRASSAKRRNARACWAASARRSRRASASIAASN